jgi:hypothetical protein
MDSISSEIPEHFGGSISAVRSPTMLPDALQELNQYDFVARAPSKGRQDVGFGQNKEWQSKTARSQSGDPQMQGWRPLTVSQYAEGFHGEVQEQGSLVGSGFVYIPNEPSMEDLAAENARLKATIARLSQAQPAEGPETPAAKARPTGPQTTPRKRKAARVEDLDTSPSNRPHQRSPGAANSSPCLIQAMWGEGVTPEQRRAMVEGPAGQTSIATPTPAVKNARARAPKKVTGRAKKLPQQDPNQQHRASFTAAGAPILPTPQVSRSTGRPISELHDKNFMSLGLEEKARILLPLLQGYDLVTGERFNEPGTLALEVQALVEQFQKTEALATLEMNAPFLLENETASFPFDNYIPATNDSFDFISTDNSLDFTPLDSSLSLTSDTSFDLTSPPESFTPDAYTKPSTTDFKSILQTAAATISSPESGAIRQREALEQHERRVAEGRRR